MRRAMAQIPDDIYEKLEEIASSEHRSIGSVIVHACDNFIKVRSKKSNIALSPEYQALLEQLKKDLGR